MAEAPDTDYVEMVLSFIDNKDGRLFEAELDTSSFDAVKFDPTPAVLPDGASVWIEMSESY